MKNVLLTNDDGFGAPGINALLERFSAEEDIRVIVVAPDGQRSATSHAINFYQPVQLIEKGTDLYAIDGSPADCVKIARGFLAEPIDMVISGVNQGPNMGVDTFYSGTVAAAREAAINNIPALAVSLAEWDGEMDFTYSAEVALKFAHYFLETGFTKNSFYNINVPNIPPEQIQGARCTCLGRRVYNEWVDKRVSPRGQTYFWVASDGLTHEPHAGSDLDAVEAGYVSITPLMLDTTDYPILEDMKKKEISGIL